MHTQPDKYTKLRKRIRLKIAEAYKVNESAISVPVGDKFTTPEFLGWWAQKYKAGNYPEWWSIYRSKDKTKGFVGSVTDDGHISMSYPYRHESDQPNLANNPLQAIRYLYLKTQEPISESQKNITEVILKDTIALPVEGWKAVRVDRFMGASKPRELGWMINAGMHPNRFWVATIWDNGDLYWNGVMDNTDSEESRESEKRPDLANNPEQVARYIWLKTQKPISHPVAESVVDTEKDFTMGHDVGDVVFFDDLGYSAMLQNSYSIRPGQDSGIMLNWTIFQEKNNTLVAQLWVDGKIQIKELGKGSFGMSNTDYGLQDFSGNLNKAVRYVWLKRQKPLKENWLRRTISKIVSEDQRTYGKNEVDIPGLDGWWAKYFEEEAESGDVLEAHWEIYEGQEWKGTIWDYGTLNTKEDGEEENRDDLVNNPVQTARYIYLKAQRPVYEGGPQKVFNKIYPPIGETEYFEDIGGWFVRSVNNSTIEIYQPFLHMPKYGKVIGRLFRFKDGRTELNYKDSDGEDYKTEFPWSSFSDVKNAVRLVFLKNQRPLTEKKKTTKKKFSDGLFGNEIELSIVKSWGARPLANKNGWEIYSLIRPATSNSSRLEKLVGAIYNDGTLIWDDSTIASDAYGEKQTERGRTDLVNNPRKTAQYLYLKKQVPLSEAETGTFHIPRIPEKTIDLKSFPGWKAIRYAPKKGVAYWVIRIELGDIAGYHSKWVGSIDDKGELDWMDDSNGATVRKESHRLDLANNPEKTAQYIWLKRQEPIT